VPVIEDDVGQAQQQAQQVGVESVGDHGLSATQQPAPAQQVKSSVAVITPGQVTHRSAGDPAAKVRRSRLKVSCDGLERGDPGIIGALLPDPVGAVHIDGKIRLAVVGGLMISAA
jgi:hypothetical protein